MVPEELRAIYSLLEAEYSPLDLCARIAPLLDKLDTLGAPLSAASPVQDASLAQYKPALQQARCTPCLAWLPQASLCMYGPLHWQACTPPTALLCIFPALSMARVSCAEVLIACMPLQLMRI
jgi:hypothetical protein